MISRFLLLLALHLTLVWSQPSCQLCEPGSTLGAADRAFPIGDFGTCGNLDAVLAEIPAEDCEETLNDILEEVDFRKYCGCSDYEGSESTCGPLCGEGTLVNPTIPIMEFDGLSCSDISDLSDAIILEESCTNVAAASDFCCVSSQNDTCQLCLDGDSELRDPNREIPFLDDISCQEYEAFLSDYSKDSMVCTNPPFGIRMDVFCGCRGSTLPNVCNFCSSRPETFDPDASFVVNIFQDTFTCSEIAEIASFVGDEDTCSEFFEPLEDLCCPLPTDDLASDFPSDAPSDTPSAVPTIAPQTTPVKTAPTPEDPSVGASAPTTPSGSGGTSNASMSNQCVTMVAVLVALVSIVAL